MIDTRENCVTRSFTTYSLRKILFGDKIGQERGKLAKGEKYIKTWFEKCERKRTLRKYIRRLLLIWILKEQDLRILGVFI